MVFQKDGKWFFTKESSMAKKKYKIILTPFDVQFNSTKTLLIHVLCITLFGY
jgi:hypothetical protein